MKKKYSILSRIHIRLSSQSLKTFFWVRLSVQRFWDVLYQPAIPEFVITEWITRFFSSCSSVFHFGLMHDFLKFTGEVWTDTEAMYPCCPG